MIMASFLAYCKEWESRWKKILAPLGKIENLSVCCLLILTLFWAFLCMLVEPVLHCWVVYLRADIDCTFFLSVWHWLEDVLVICKSKGKEYKYHFWQGWKHHLFAKLQQKYLILSNLKQVDGCIGEWDQIKPREQAKKLLFAVHLKRSVVESTADLNHVCCVLSFVRLSRYGMCWETLRLWPH